MKTLTVEIMSESDDIVMDLCLDCAHKAVGMLDAKSLARQSERV